MRPKSLIRRVLFKICSAMRLNRPTLFIAIPLFFASILGDGLLSASKATSSFCPAVGRVLSKGDSKLPVGRLICMGEKVQLAQLPSVRVLCFVSGRVKQFATGQVVSQTEGCNAPPRQTQQLRRCGAQEIYLCVRPKGPNDQTLALRLTYPYGRVVSTMTPALRWHREPQAHHYMVQVEGKGVNWQQNVASPSLSYPKNRPPLQQGQAYKITIAAYNQQNALLNVKQSVLNVLPHSTVQAMNDRVEQVRGLNLGEDEATVLDLTSIYLTHGLLHDAIVALQARADAGSRTPLLYRVLADCYLTVGRSDLAKPHYEKAISLAKAVSDQDVLVSAQAGLRQLAN